MRYTLIDARTGTSLGNFDDPQQLGNAWDEAVAHALEGDRS